MKITYEIKIDMPTYWDEKYLAQVGYFSNVTGINCISLR